MQRPSWRVDCGGIAGFSSPELGNAGLPALGSSYDITLSKAAASSIAVLISGLSDQVHQGIALPVMLPGAPGCSVYAAPETTQAELISATGDASATFMVPNSAGLIGLDVFHQWAVLDTVNALNLVVSDAGKASIGI